MTGKAEEWTSEGRNILSADRLAKIRSVLEDRGPIIVEHWFYYGSRAPERVVFDDYDDFSTYLRERGKPGDAFHVWSYAEVCRDDNELAGGKYPDAAGRTPLGGAY